MKKSLIIYILGLMSWIYAQETTRFMVVADPHNYSPVSNFKETIFFEIVLAAIDEEVDFIFFPGDLVIRGFGEFAEKDSVLKDWRFVLDTLSTHDIKVLACRGNNDLSSKESWDSLFSGPYSFPQNGPENEKNITYAFEYNNILFIALDQYTDNHRITQTWLDSILSQKQKTHIFAAGHEPAFKLLHNSYMGAYPAARDSLWESLLSAGAKIYFCGHDHFYDHSIIDDGDGNPQNDMHQVIVGTASSLHQNVAFDGDNGRWTPDSIFHEKTNGYVLVEVEGDDVKFTWKHRTEANAFAYGGDSYTFLTNLPEYQNVLLNYELFQNYPNPFNPSTTIKFQIPNSKFTTLKVYNILGKEVATLVSRKLNQGNHTYTFDGKNLASGIYYYQLVAGEHREVKKMILLR